MAKFKPGRWTIREDLGGGGQGYTYVVVDKETNEVGVLKRLKNMKRFERFKREVATLQALHGKVRVPRVLDDAGLTGSDDPWFVMELFTDGTLADHAGAIARDPIPSLIVVEEILAQLSIVHASGYVHRDIKPANILVVKKANAFEPWLGDFGIAFVDDEEEERMTDTSEAVGPARYMAPELEGGRADDVSAAADVYSVGKLLWWSLTGDTPPPRELHRKQGWNLVERLGPRFEAVNDLLDGALAFAPADRPTADTFAQSIATFRRTMTAPAAATGSGRLHGMMREYADRFEADVDAKRRISLRRMRDKKQAMDTTMSVVVEAVRPLAAELPMVIDPVVEPARRFVICRVQRNVRRMQAREWVALFRITAPDDTVVVVDGVGVRDSDAVGLTGVAQVFDALGTFPEQVWSGPVDESGIALRTQSWLEDLVVRAIDDTRAELESAFKFAKEAAEIDEEGAFGGWEGVVSPPAAFTTKTTKVLKR